MNEGASAGVEETRGAARVGTFAAPALAGPGASAGPARALPILVLLGRDRRPDRRFDDPEELGATPVETAFFFAITIWGSRACRQKKRRDDRETLIALFVHSRCLVLSGHVPSHEKGRVGRAWRSLDPPRDSRSAGLHGRCKHLEVADNKLGSPSRTRFEKRM